MWPTVLSGSPGGPGSGPSVASDARCVRGCIRVSVRSFSKTFAHKFIFISLNLVWLCRMCMHVVCAGVGRTGF